MQCSFSRTFLCTVLLASGLLLSSCQKSSASSNTDAPGGDFGEHPRTTLPDELVGYWLTGSSSITNFWGYDGTYAGNAMEIAVGYMLYKNGTAKQYFYWTKTSSYCRDQILGYRQGTVTFDKEAKTFRFYAASGKYRRFDRCGSSTSPGFGETKTYGSADLYPKFKAEYNNSYLTQVDGKTIWRNVLADGSFLDYEKSSQPQ